MAGPFGFFPMVTGRKPHQVAELSEPTIMATEKRPHLKAQSPSPAQTASRKKKKSNPTPTAGSHTPPPTKRLQHTTSNRPPTQPAPTETECAAPSECRSTSYTSFCGVSTVSSHPHKSHCPHLPQQGDVGSQQRTIHHPPLALVRTGCAAFGGCCSTPFARLR